MHSSNLFLDLFLMLAFAKVLGELCERVRIPVVVGEMMAGVLLGPFVLGWVRPGELHDSLAQLGVVFLLFAIGLETDPQQLFRVGRVAGLVAILGVIVPFAGGFVLMLLLQRSALEAVFVGAALMATSVGITARVLADQGVLAARASRVILGAAVVDDVFGMLVLGVVFALSNGSLDWIQMGAVALVAVAFVAFLALVGRKVVARLHRPVARMRSRNPGFTLALLLCLGFSLAATYVGMAAIIGAFLAGLALTEKKEEWALVERVETVTDFLAPFFFVVLGMRLDLGVFAQPAIIGSALLVTLVAVLGKLLGCGIGALSLGLRDSVRIGVGMATRGEVVMIVALLGLEIGAISQEVFGMLVFMVVVLSLTTPFILVRLFRNVNLETPS